MVKHLCLPYGRKNGRYSGTESPIFLSNTAMDAQDHSTEDQFR